MNYGIFNKSTGEFFAGFDENGAILWTTDKAKAWLDTKLFAETQASLLVSIGDIEVQRKPVAILKETGMTTETIPCYFNKVRLQEEFLEQAREWYYNNAMACIEEAKEIFPNDPEKVRGITNWKLDTAEKSLTIGLPGGERVSVAFLQKAYFFQTGDCIAILP